MILTDPRRFAGVDAWLFDLDNTLYPAECRLFDQIDRRMTGFIAELLEVDDSEADRLRAVYWRDHGTTLNGLMREHGLAPDAFLDFVHDIDLSAVAPDPELASAVSALPGRKFVFTNGSRGHAARVCAQLGLTGCFEALFGIEDAGFEPKPRRAAYERILSAAAMSAEGGVMVEDTARNLVAPHEMGMVTVWTPTDCALAKAGADGDHVHFVAEDLRAFLTALAPDAPG